MNQKGFAKIILIVVIVAIVGAVGLYFYRLPPIKYWAKNPTNFEECKEATRGFIIKTLPAQCEFRGQNFVDRLAQQPAPTPIQTQQVTIAGHIVAFEQAVNKSDFSNASKYFADKVYVVLEGSSCCGEIPASQAKMYLENGTKGLVFTFNPNDAVVKEYTASQYIDYPNRRLIKDSPKLYFDELSIGVESDVLQQNKASIGYKAFNDKITVLFINKGRDR